MDDEKEFWDSLGGRGPVAPDAGDDDVYEKASAEEVRLWHVSDESGELVVDELDERPFQRDFLDTMDCYILDAKSEIYVWIGKG